jgi:hypothetical protein
LFKADLAALGVEAEPETRLYGMPPVEAAAISLDR